MIENKIIGRVQSSDTSEGIIQILLLQPSSKVHIGMPIVFKDDEYKYFCMIVRIYQPQNKTAVNIARRKDFDPNLGTQLTSNPHTSAFNIFVDAKCLKRWKISDGKVYKSNFVSIPNVFTKGTTATFEELQQVYSNVKFENYWFGALDSVEERDEHGNYRGLPINMNEMVTKPMGIFGATGFGKSVTMRNLCKAVIHDPDEELKTSMLIFDVQDEYSYKVQDSNEVGLLGYPIIEDRMRVFTLDPHSWNMNVKAEHTTTSGFAKKFRLFKRNITAEDVLAILENDTFSDVMRQTIYDLEHDAFKRGMTIFETMEEFYHDIDGYGAQINENESSRKALRRRMKPIIDGVLSQFIEDGDPSQKDTVELIEDDLDKRINVDDPKSFILHFGQHGKKEYVYTFIATVLTRKLYDLYSGMKNQYDEELQSHRFHQLVIVLEEAHKFISKNGGIKVFEYIARETRKFGLTLWYADQMPSSISQEIIAQSAHRIIHKLNGGEDIKVSLSGLNKYQWTPIINNLEKGRCLVFGPMVDYMPTIIHSYYNPNDIRQEKEDRGMPLSSISKSALTGSSSLPSKKTRKVKKTQPKGLPVVTKTRKTVQTTQPQSSDEKDSKQRVGLLDGLDVSDASNDGDLDDDIFGF